MLNYYYRSIRDQEFKKTISARRGAVGVIEQATHRDITKVAETLDVDLIDVIDILDIQEIPRLEVNNGLVLLFVRSPLPLEDKEMVETQLYMVMYKDKRLYVATNGSADVFLETLAQSGAASTQPSRLMVAFLLKLSRKYSQYINEIAKRVEEKRRFLNKISEQDIEQLINYETILNEYVSALAPMQRMCASLTTRPQIGWYEEDKDLIEDLMTSLGQSADVCIVNLKKILTLRDSFQIIFTNRLNQTLKVLTSVTIILTIPTMIASLFGMNVRLPFDGIESAFWIIMGIAALAAFGVSLIFRKNKWM